MITEPKTTKGQPSPLVKVIYDILHTPFILVDPKSYPHHPHMTRDDDKPMTPGQAAKAVVVKPGSSLRFFGDEKWEEIAQAAIDASPLNQLLIATKRIDDNRPFDELPALEAWHRGRESHTFELHTLQREVEKLNKANVKLMEAAEYAAQKLEENGWYAQAIRTREKVHTSLSEVTKESK